ncbi:MAG: WecB/TagA/CpsF family glycosyltransferase [Clostridia bacterium]|nr:WecB/TagA/CpsF family glycosyltransferase [Clostridia bacterium]
MKKIQIRGLRFDNVTMEEAIALAAFALKEQRSVSVFTPNAEIARLAEKDASVRDLLNRADLLLPDGAGVVLASRILKTPLTEKVAGVEFGSNILSLAARSGYPVFFLGGKPGVAALAAEKQKARLPSLSVVGTHDGYFQKNGIENDAVLRQINESGAAILFVCFGAPAQERWIDENRDKLPRVRLLAGLGGSLDVYAGIVRRAPDFLIRARLEWLYRLWCDPRRIGRMMKIPQYLAGAYSERLFCKKDRLIGK